MKLSSSKPISSPGRTEKFPPPLMRFLRSNVSSKSRGRSRASPLFMRKLKSITSSSPHQGSSNTLETQEPTSPKVTCIGQVRVRRSKNISTKKPSSSRNPKNRPTKCINNTASKGGFCSCLPKPGLCNCKLTRPRWPKWVLWFGCCSVRVRTESSKHSGSARFEEASAGHGHGHGYGQEQGQDSEEEEDGYEFDRGRRSSVSLVGTTMETATSTPPKNALLLTRCRSAPYRSSSLACRFWGENEDEEQQQKGEENKATTALETAELILLNSRDSTSESRGDQEDSRSSCGNTSSTEEISKCVGVCAEEVVVAEAEDNSNLMAVRNEGGENDVCGDKGEKVNYEIGRTLMLMRCKSEPARRGLEKFDPQSSEFWQLRRLGNTEDCTPHVLVPKS